MKTKEEVLREAREHINFSKEFAAPLAPGEDPVQRWAREGREAEQREQRARAELRRAERRERRMAERAAVRAEEIEALRAELTELHALIAKGDAAVLNHIATVVLPVFDKVADRVDAISTRVDERLKALESLVRGSIAAPGGTVHELPRRNVN